jgi:broad specificity phosphatase PhoE
MIASRASAAAEELSKREVADKANAKRQHAAASAAAKEAGEAEAVILRADQAAATAKNEHEEIEATKAEDARASAAVAAVADAAKEKEQLDALVEDAATIAAREAAAAAAEEAEELYARELAEATAAEKVSLEFKLKAAEAATAAKLASETAAEEEEEEARLAVQATAAAATLTLKKQKREVEVAAEASIAANEIALKFVRHVLLVPFGVLGQQMTSGGLLVNQAPEPFEAPGHVFLDPAGLHHIQPPGGPSGAHGAAGAIYKSIGIDKNPSFPHDVVQAITKTSDAKYHKYMKSGAEVHALHAVGPDLRTDADPTGAPGVPFTREQALGALSLAYKNVLTEFLSSGQPALRLLPLSGGIFAGSFASQIPSLTWEALREAFLQLSLADQEAILRKHLDLCIFAEKDVASFVAAGFSPDEEEFAAAAENVAAAASAAAETRPEKSSSEAIIPDEKVEKHEKKDVSQLMDQLHQVGQTLRPTLPFAVKAARCEDKAEMKPGSSQVTVKKVHFIRHGQGHHNVAQAAWRNSGKEGEPYWTSTDPKLKFKDAELTEVGRGQATALRLRTEELAPELMVVSPMRRATLTGLLAFESHVARGALSVVAHECAHEIAGKHTCDFRLSLSELKKMYPVVDYSHVVDEEDPFWGDGSVREPLSSVAARAAKLMEFVRSRPEKHVVVAAHSTILATLMNSVVGVEGPADEVKADTEWFGTGEMRSFLVSWEPQDIVQIIKSGQPCGNFEIDLQAAAFGSCKCGYLKAAHMFRYDGPSRSVNKAQFIPVQKEASNACGNFEIDVHGSFGSCKCGFLKAEHEFTPGHVGRSGGKVSFVPIKTDPTGACKNYSVDLTAAAFGQCICGFAKSAHVPDTVRLKFDSTQSQDDVDTVKPIETTESRSLELLAQEKAGPSPSSSEFNLASSRSTEACDTTTASTALLFSPSSYLRTKIAVFHSERLSIQLLQGASKGHLPVLKAAITIEAFSRANKSTAASLPSLSLQEGDQLAEVAGVSLVGCADPLSKAVALIRSHTNRPISLGFLAASPEPYSVSFTEVSLGIAFEQNAWEPAGFPVVWDTQRCPQPFPAVGDALVAVNGERLCDANNKLKEATQRIQESPRPLTLLFQPPAAAAVERTGGGEGEKDAATPFGPSQSATSETGNGLDICGAYFFLSGSSGGEDKNEVSPGVNGAFNHCLPPAPDGPLGNGPCIVS